MIDKISSLCVKDSSMLPDMGTKLHIPLMFKNLSK